MLHPLPKKEELHVAVPIVTMQTRVTDPAAVAACQRLSLAAPLQGIGQFFSGEANGLIVQLSRWRYHAVLRALIVAPM